MQENKVSDKIEVLLVDDRPENLLALETVLESPEYKLVKANSGDEALRYLLDHEPALILLDVQMPDLDGFETATLIKRSERTRSIPIIFVTALNQDDRYVLKGYQHGAIDYLYKPFDPNILRSKVAVFAELARKTRSLILAERKISEAEKKDRERQIAQLELRSLKREQLEQKKYLDLVAGITHGIVWSVDSDSMSTSFVSPSSLKILGYAESDWLDDQDFFLNLIPPADRKFFNDAIDRAKLSNESEKLEHRFVTHEGNELWFQTELKLAHKTDSSGYEIRGISMDITRMKEVQEMLETAVKVRDEFLSVASHELKTPLTPLKLQAQMLGRVLKAANGAELKSEKVDKILVTFDRQIDRLSLLIDELLDISKMTNGKLRVI
jgi:CheY-like chemotaxis protein